MKMFYSSSHALLQINMLMHFIHSSCHGVDLPPSINPFVLTADIDKVVAMVTTFARQITATPIPRRKLTLSNYSVRQIKNKFCK